MRTIYKYSLEYDKITTIELPEFSIKILHVDYLRKDGVCIWVELDTDEEHYKERSFKIFGTGQEIPEDLTVRYIGTCKQPDVLMTFIWHVYEVI